MKFLLFIAAVAVAFVSLTSVTRADATEVTLKQAIKNNWVTISAKSNGMHSGRCVVLSINSKHNKLLKIKVLPGDHFLPEDEGDQTIIITNEKEIYASKGAAVTTLLEGYCCESSDSSPPTGSSFTFGRTNNKKLLQLVQFMNTKNIPEDIKQEAVWTVADNNDASGIYDELNEAVKELRAEVNEINEREDVWYNSERNYTIAPDRSIVKEPVSLNGDLTAKIDRAGTVSYAVYDTDGNQKSVHQLKMDLPGAGEYTMNFRLKVEGWEEGTYTVRILFEGEPIHTVDFKV